MRVFAKVLGATSRQLATAIINETSRGILRIVLKTLRPRITMNSRILSNKKLPWRRTLPITLISIDSYPQKYEFNTARFPFVSISASCLAKKTTEGRRMLPLCPSALKSSSPRQLLCFSRTSHRIISSRGTSQRSPQSGTAAPRVQCGYRNRNIQSRLNSGSVFLMLASV